MPDTPAHLSERMLHEGQRSLEFFRLLKPEQWGTLIYTEGTTWEVRDLLAHFVSAEAGVTRLVENILAGGQGAAEDFDLNAYNERKVAGLKQASPDDLLLEFARLREKSAVLVKELDQNDLEKVGRHPWLGITTIGEIIKMMYRHNQIHQRDIRRALDSDKLREDG
jgi:hypothetical protein